MDFFISFLLVCLSGMFSGLTIGLMGLSFSDVKRSSDLGDMRATKILPLIENSNLLLVTLLLGNTATNSTLSIFISGAVGEGLTAGIVATALILIFGEILPSALVSKHVLSVGAFVSPFVNLLVTLFYPLTFLIAKFLDKYVGKVGEMFFSKREIIHIIENHAASAESDLDKLDKEVIVGTLLLSGKKVGEHMSSEWFTVKEGTIISDDFVNLIKEEGYTRIPVMREQEFIGVLNCKYLLGIDTSKNIKVEELMNNNKVIIDADTTLDNALPTLIRSHIACVSSYNRIVGIITLEDVVEELLRKEIKDEFDQ